MSQLPEEAWREVPGYEGLYQVSDLGRVRSLDRVVVCKSGRSRVAGVARRKGRVLAPVTVSSGYFGVSLCKNGVGTLITIHRLVLLAFSGNPPPGHVCCHNDGNQKNNRLTNLRWDDVKNNCGDKVAHGTLLMGEQNPASKLTEDGVRKIKRLLADGVEGKDVAALFGVTPAAISAINTGKNWGWLESTQQPQKESVQ